MSIAENIVRVQERIATAARRAHRDPASITLMAVSKTFPPESVREAYAARLRVFGENRVQEFSAKANAVKDLSDTEWHLIGHLQSNKTAKATELFNAVDSLDSVKLAEKLDAAAKAAGKTLPVLIEINVGAEAAKTGVDPTSAEIDKILLAAPAYKNLAIRGLMTVPPYSDDPESARPYFRELRAISDKIARRNLTAVAMTVLSMGMSHDFEVAIEEGSTCVRVGTAIFGERQRR